MKNKVAIRFVEIIIAIVFAIVAYNVALMFLPKSDDEKLLNDLNKTFNEYKKISYMEKEALDNAVLLNDLFPGTKEAKEAESWVIANGKTIEGLKRDDSIKNANTPKISNADMNNLQKDFQLYRSLPGNSDEAFEKVHIAFDGMPPVKKVRPMMEAVMTRYKIVLNNENVLRVGNMLVSLKNESKVGVTEMDILKHIYQNGSSDTDLPTQAGISAAILELY